PKDNEVGAHVRVLQEALVSLGYLDSKPTGIYGPKTRDAVAAFQVSQGLVLSKADPNAGKFGKLTRTKMLLSLAQKNVR
ncbi:MAG: peptidoglycan-binding domain-containing protein, partial [Patescibacteria group bacterium]